MDDFSATMENLQSFGKHLQIKLEYNVIIYEILESLFLIKGSDKC